MKRVVILLLVFLGAAEVGAQSPTPAELPPLPAGPLPARLGKGQWTITETVTTPKAAGSPSGEPGRTDKPEKQPVPKAIRVSKAGDLRFEQGSDGLGELSRWCDGPFQFLKRAGWANYVMVTASDTTGDYVDFSRTDFPDCNWINADNYCEATDALYVFKNKKAVKHPDESVDPPMSLTCYLDKKTMLPTKVMTPGRALDFRYNLEVAPNLKLPDELQSLENVYKARMGDLKRRSGPA